MSTSSLFVKNIVV